MSIVERDKQNVCRCWSQKCSTPKKGMRGNKQKDAANSIILSQFAHTIVLCASTQKYPIPFFVGQSPAFEIKYILFFGTYYN